MTNKTTVDRADSTPVKVIEQGFPVLSAGDAWVSHRHDDIALVNLDMQTKWCTVSCISSNNGVPSVMIEGTDRATQIVHDRGMTDDDRWTEVEFPEFAGWDIEMAECHRYTVQVLFTKRGAYA